MKNIFLTFLTGASLFLTSCEKDFEEINTNPNKPKTSLSYALFNGGNKWFMDYTRYYTTSGKLIRSWMQYTAQDTYTKESRFLYSDYSGDYIWRFAYQVAGQYKEIIELNTDPKTQAKTATYGNNDNQIAAARIMMGYVMSMLTETFGDIPYYSWHGKDNPKFQALQLDKYISPEYASQEDIYADMLADLKEAVEQIRTTDPTTGRAITNVFTAGDVIFGTPQKMRKFGNSLRLRIAIHLSDVEDNNLKQLAINTIREIVNNPTVYPVMESNADTVELMYENNDTNPSPIYKNYFVNRRTDYSPANTFVDILKGTRGSFGQDPRLQKYFAPIGHTKYQVRAGNYHEESDINKYKGMTYGIDEEYSDSQFDSEKGVSLFSKKILSADYAEVLMEYSEVCFLLSEAKYIVNGTWDQTSYEKGIRASMEKWGVSSSDISAYLTRIASAGLQANQENVITQKYIALYMNPNEAWTEYRRTGYPNILIRHGETVPLNKNIGGMTSYVFTSLVAELTDIPARLQYSTEFKNINFYNYRKALEAMGMSEDSMAKKLIFAKR